MHHPSYNRESAERQRDSDVAQFVRQRHGGLGCYDQGTAAAEVVSTDQLLIRPKLSQRVICSCRDLARNNRI